MRYFKVRVNPDVVATISVSDYHLKIYKEILRIKTDRGFGISLQQWIKDDLEIGNHPKVTKALLENNLQMILCSIASGHLKSFFTEDVVEIDETDEESVDAAEERIPEQDGNVLQFIGE